MELLCPNCQQKLNIREQYAGQIMRCPLCNGMFTAPAMGGAAPPPPPVYSPPASSEPFYSGGAPPPPAPAPAPPPLPPGELTKCCTLTISPRVVPWIAPLCLGLVLLMTFLPWDIGPFGSINAWRLGFGPLSNLLFTFYLLLTALGLACAVVSLLTTLGVIPLPQELKTWLPVIVGCIVGSAFLLFAVKYLQPVFQHAVTPLFIWTKLAIRFHALAVVGLALEFWLERRRLKNLPPPKIEFHR